MTREEARDLTLGIYLVKWNPESGGGKSLAAVGMDYFGDRWLAPINWTAPSFAAISERQRDHVMTSVTAPWWSNVESMVLLLGQADLHSDHLCDEKRSPRANPRSTAPRCVRCGQKGAGTRIGPDGNDVVLCRAHARIKPCSMCGSLEHGAAHGHPEFWASKQPPGGHDEK